MKKLFIAIILSFSILSLNACNKDDEGNEQITVNGKAAEALNMAANGDSKTVVVRGSQPWQAEAAEWITVTPMSGTANKDITVTISVGANNDQEERLGGVNFSLPTEEFATVLVEQAILSEN